MNRAKKPDAATARALANVFLLGDVSTFASGWRVALIRLSMGESRLAFGHRLNMKASALQAVEVGRSYLRPKYAKPLYEEIGFSFNFVYYGETRDLTLEQATELCRAADLLPPPSQERIAKFFL